MLPKRHRLTRPEDFTAVFRGGAARSVTRTRRAGTPLLVVHRADRSHRGSGPARVGFVVSKAVGNSVVRHRVTRQLRHLVAARTDAGCTRYVCTVPATIVPSRSRRVERRGRGAPCGRLYLYDDREGTFRWGQSVIVTVPRLSTTVTSTWNPTEP